MAKAAHKTPEININLLPKQGPADALNKAINWILTIGRYLIIGTEVVALAIFILSIVLAAEKNFLKENIEDLKTEVTAQAAFEKEFRQTTDHISEIKRIRREQNPTNKILDEFLKLLPEAMALENMDMREGVISFSGSFATPSQLQTMVLSFSSSEKLTGLDLNKLSAPNDKNPNFTFTATVGVAEGAF